MECKSSTTANSMPGMCMITRSGVDENTVFFSGKTDTTRATAIVAWSGDLTISSQSDVDSVEEEQTFIDKEGDQETNGQYPVSSKQQVDKLLIVFNELDDTAQLNIDVKDLTTIFQSIVDELFSEQSSSISYENDVLLKRASYPETIEGCIQVINELRHAQKALHLTITNNEHLLECLQSDGLRAERELDKEHREQEHRESEYHRGYHEEHRGRDQEGK